MRKCWRILRGKRVGEKNVPDRIVRAGILTSDAVNTLSWPAEVLYRRLHSIVDDYGRYDGRSSLLRAHLYPLKIDKVSEADVGKWLTECVTAGLVSFYRVAGRPYVEVTKFGARVRAETSKWPSSDDAEPQSLTTADICAQPHADAAVFVDVDVDVEKGVITPSSPAVAADPPTPPSPTERLPCPHGHIRALFAEKLPSLPQIRKWDADRERALRSRWSEQAREKGWTTADEGIEWFGRFFIAVSENDWAMGRSGRGKGHEKWECDIDYLLSVKGFRRIIETAGREAQPA